MFEFRRSSARWGVHLCGLGRVWSQASGKKYAATVEHNRLLRCVPMVVRRRSRALQHPFELWGVDDEDLLAERLTRGKRRGGTGADDGVRSGRRHVVGGQPERRCHGGGGRLRRCRLRYRDRYQPERQRDRGAVGQGHLGAQSASAGKLAVSANAELGNVLTDSAGLTLYRFDEDTAEPPKSNCDGDCATAWPPVPADDASAGDGIDKALLGEVTRADGSKQLTIGGWPAYRYAKDTKAGDSTGQGVGGKWYALAPDGKKASRSARPREAGLSTRNDPKLGEIVVDKNGMTVYRFAKDKAWPEPVSNCTGACLEKWPVVAPVDGERHQGHPEEGLMSFTRSDGVKQQTINCSPIYTFAGDKQPGDTNGQGVGGTWYAVRPNGKLVGAPTSDARLPPGTTGPPPPRRTEGAGRFAVIPARTRPRVGARSGTLRSAAPYFS